MFGVEMKSFGTDGWQPTNMFDQPELESYLRQEAVNHPQVDALIGCEALQTANVPGGVRVRFNDGTATRELDASYAIACDGASSPTRKSLGIGWRDLGYDHQWLVVDVIVNDRHELGNDTLQVCDPDRIVTYVCTKDPYRRWEFKMKPGETAEQMLEDGMIRSLIDPWTPRDTYELRRAAVYQFHAATADRWRDGNIFIAGDAAHQTPPFLGQGLNAGLRDVINIAWKIPMVLDGVVEDRFLDSYYEERNAHAHDLVEWAVSIGRLMDHLAEVERCERDGLAPPPEMTALKSSGYGQGREIPPIRDGLVLLDQVSDTGSTGYLFPQPIVRDESGRGVRLDDILGDGFALVARTEQGLKLGSAARAVLERLGARLVSLETLEPVRGHFDRLFDEHEAAIIRPDRLVFGHTTRELSADELILKLAEKLALKR